MRVRSLTEMLLEYGIDKLDPDDDSERQKMLTSLPFSVIVEGEHMELENLEKWLGLTFGKEAIKDLYYGKIGYNFSFVEYFFADVTSMENTIQAVPRIYTIYPYSLTPDKPWRSLGYEGEEVHDPNDKTAIIYLPEKKT